MISVFDHVLSPLKDNDLAGNLRRFEQAGFVVPPDQIRHRCGRLTGFARMTGTYLEFMSVVDEDEFRRDAAQADRVLRQDPHPYGVGSVASDPHEVYRRLRPDHPKMLPPATHAAVGDSSRRPRWTIVMLPRPALPGTNLSAIRYHERRPDAFRLRQGPNTVFALGGFVFCTSRGDEHRAAWRTTLARIAHPPIQERGAVLHVGAQQVEWISPEDYWALYGAAFNRMYEDFGALAAVKLLCTDLEVARDSLVRAGFRAVRTSDRVLFHRDANTGFAFELLRADPDEFIHLHSPQALAAP